MIKHTDANTELMSKLNELIETYGVEVVNDHFQLVLRSFGYAEVLEIAPVQIEGESSPNLFKSKK